jgi:hypothetical protein
MAQVRYREKKQKENVTIFGNFATALRAKVKH